MSEGAHAWNPVSYTAPICLTINMGVSDGIAARHSSLAARPLFFQCASCSHYMQWLCNQRSILERRKIASYAVKMQDS